MQELIATFHIDWKLMAAQIINFVIVFLVLWRFALKPLMKTMAERAKTIEESLNNAAAIEQRVKDTNNETTKKITEARAQALAIMNEAKKQAEEKRQELLTKAKADVEKVVSQAQEQIEHEKDAALHEARKELGALVVAGIGKVLGTALSEKVDKDLVKDQLHHLK